MVEGDSITTEHALKCHSPSLSPVLWDRTYGFNKQLRIGRGFGFFKTTICIGRIARKDERGML